MALNEALDELTCPYNRYLVNFIFLGRQCKIFCSDFDIGDFD